MKPKRILYNLLSFLRLNACIKLKYNSENEDSSLYKDNIENEDESKWCPENFVCLQRLDKGNFGEIFLIQHKETSEKAALKVLFKQHYQVSNPICVQRERRGWKMACRHPHIVTFRTYFETTDSFNFISDYIPGGNLYRFVTKNGPLGEYVTKILTSQLGSAIQYIHSIIHRDIGAKNILLSQDGNALLTDFGLCTLKLESCTLCGTPVYMAPEVLKHEKYDKSVDWWSFGVLVYMMLVGKTPIDIYLQGLNSPSTSTIMCQTIKVTDSLDPSSIFPLDLSQEAKSFITQLLQKDVKKRLGSRNEEEIRKHEFLKGIPWPLATR
ncbi:serine/threonine-protein kinase AtPK1/AtPK6-like isoform X2 [Centruroides sculpturatus]|uniref:serine/threonine-protein kinase AtPK1/AtPK6-like isoform X2 n=1 Tax=Centruroides sculpturatus TaxID=218467 RepID=UPI000C6CA561|nr:serine/threonine-protein kinase AtPK1/AtPK6-like isoform X2 [Centruroides sculpturatus]